MTEPGNSSSIIGLTSTIPVEIVFAAGLKPVDLNNVFINSDKAQKLVAQAESAGFAHNICAWIKGSHAFTSLMWGSRLLGGRHFTILVINTWDRAMPIAINILSSN